MSEASRDGNFVTTLLAVSSVDGVTPVTLYANPTTHRLLVDLAGGGSGTVQTVAIATANGFAGTSDANPASPTLTISTSITGILKGNGTAISAAVAGTDYGNVYKVGTPVNNQVGVWTGDGTIEGDTALTFDTATDTLSVGGPIQMLVNQRLGFDSTNETIESDGSAMRFRVNGALVQRIDDGKVTIGRDDISASGKLNVYNTADSSSVQTLTLQGDRATPANNDEVYQSFYLSDSGGTQTEFARITVRADDVTDTSEDGSMLLYTTVASSLATASAVLSGTTLRPGANDGRALGTSTVSWSDLFLAEGGVINWDNGDMTITQASNVMTIAGGNVLNNNFVSSYTTTATAAGTTTLTVDSTHFQFFTGATTQTVTLPVTSTLTTGHSYFIKNLSSGVVTVNSSGGNLVASVAAGATVFVTCILTSGTTAASWNANLTALFYAGGKTLTVNNSLTLAGTDGTTMTFPSADATIAGIASTQTLTNKRITKRTGTTTSSATPTINTDNVDYYSITAQAVDITSMTTNLSGTPTTAQQLRIDITGTAARAITWGASFANGPVALPTTTVTTTRLYVLLEWDGSIWRCMASGSTV